ncbi:MAG: helix-turn-helix domain-containing protein [Clostridiales bacterium]|nr:helix-turn-helix domain-containing protein [Clostridiales bacterium]
MSNKRFTTDELAAALSLSRREVDRLRKAGAIPFLKIGEGRGHFLYILEDVEKALSELAEANRAEAAAKYAKTNQNNIEAVTTRRRYII